jgi:hypothetical protein
VRTFEKRREPALPGSIADALDIFRAELRFYREIAPIVGVRVPRCLEAEDTSSGTRLVLEDLSSWTAGADPVRVAAELSALHERWADRALTRFPWLRRVGAGAELVGKLFDQAWPRLRRRGDVTAEVVALGDGLTGRVAAVASAAAAAGPLTLCHGDASLRNVFTGPGGEIAFVDWEDVTCAPGVTDLAWLLVSSVPPARWDEVVQAYGPARRLDLVFPAAAVQGLLTLGDLPEASAEAREWVERLTASGRRFASA